MGLIVGIGVGVSTGGRRPELFELKKGDPTAIAIDVTPRTTTVAVADLAGTLLAKETFSTSPDVDFMTDQIIRRTTAMIEQTGAKGVEIGMSVPGLVDQANGKIFHIPYFDWRDWDIADRLEKATGSKVTVENDANATALAELWFGDERIKKSDTFVMVLVGEGIGTGIIFDGQVYRGEKGAGGEFGHMIAGDNAPVECSCGSRECWEAYASEKAFIARYKDRLRNGDLKQNEMNVDNLVQLAVDGEKHAVEAPERDRTLSREWYFEPDRWPEPAGRCRQRKDHEGVGRFRRSALSGFGRSVLAGAAADGVDPVVAR